MNLENLNVQELNTNEMKNVNGGWLGTALAVIGFGIYLYNEWDDLEKGFHDGCGC